MRIVKLETQNERRRIKPEITCPHYPPGKGYVPGTGRAVLRGPLAVLCTVILGTVLFANVAAAQQVQGGFQLTVEDLNAVQTITFTAGQNAEGVVTDRAYNLQRQRARA